MINMTWPAPPLPPKLRPYGGIEMNVLLLLLLLLFFGYWIRCINMVMADLPGHWSPSRAVNSGVAVLLHQPNASLTFCTNSSLFWPQSSVTVYLLLHETLPAALHSRLFSRLNFLMQSTRQHLAPLLHSVTHGCKELNKFRITLHSMKAVCVYVSSHGVGDPA